MRVQKNLGASLVETFTVDQIDQHLRSTAADMACLERQPGRVSKPLVPLTADETCLVCNNTTTLRFEPEPRNCVACGLRIKKNATYYVHSKPDAVWCQQCVNAASDELAIDNFKVKKSDVLDRKEKNVQRIDEEWVACDNPACDRWVHMICGLFNKARCQPRCASANVFVSEKRHSSCACSVTRLITHLLPAAKYIASASAVNALFEYMDKSITQESDCAVQGSNNAKTCYLCPWCIRKEKAAGRWDGSQPRPQSMAAAQDLPRTQLSDCIDRRVRPPRLHGLRCIVLHTVAAAPGARHRAL